MAAPINLGVDPALWWRADLGVTTASGDVSAWLSQGTQSSKSLTQSTAGSRPLFVASGQNGQPCIEFDGTTPEYLSNATITSVSQPLTVFAVQHRNTAVDLTIGEYAWNGGGVFVREFDFVGNSLLAASGGSPLYAREGGTHRPSVIVMRLLNGTGSADIVRRNGQTIISTADASGQSGGEGGTLGTSPFAATVTVGADEFGGNGYSGRLYELAVYGSALTDGQIIALEEYAFARYALQRPTRTMHAPHAWFAGRMRGGNRRAAGESSMRGAASSPIDGLSRVQVFGQAVVTGTGTGALAPLAAVGAGDAGVTVTSTGSGALAPLAGDGAGSETIDGSGSGALAALGSTGSGDEEITGSGSGAVAPLAADGTGSEIIASSGAGALAALNADAAGAAVVAVDGTGAGAIAALGATGDGNEAIDATGSAALAPLDAAGAGTETITGSGAAGLAALGAAGAGALEVAASGSCALAPLVAAGTGEVASPVTSTGSAALAPLTSIATGALEISSVGSCSIAPLASACVGAVDTPIVLASLAAAAPTSARLVSTTAAAACPAALTPSAVGAAAVAPSAATSGATTPTSARLAG